MVDCDLISAIYHFFTRQVRFNHKYIQLNQIRADCNSIVNSRKEYNGN